MDILAVARVAAGGAAFTYNKGCASVVNAGVGLNDITLNNPADAGECAIYATSLGAVGSAVSLTQVSDTVIRASTTLEAAGVATLSNAVAFSFMLVR